jgi:hypothetical protein
MPRQKRSDAGTERPLTKQEKRTQQALREIVAIGNSARSRIQKAVRDINSAVDQALEIHVLAVTELHADDDTDNRSAAKKPGVKRARRRARR